MIKVKPIVIGLDLATHSGVAIGDGTPKNTRLLTVNLKAYAHDWGILSNAWSDCLSDIIFETKAENPDFTIITSIEKGFHRGKGSAMLAGLVWDAHRIANLHEVQRREVTPTQVKKFLTGRGNAIKSEVIAAVKERGFNPANDHEADAVGLMLYTLEKEQEHV